jgi:hypothetical protein
MLFDGAGLAELLLVWVRADCKRASWMEHKAFPIEYIENIVPAGKQPQGTVARAKEHVIDMPCAPRIALEGFDQFVPALDILAFLCIPIAKALGHPG